jgi:cytochrome P450
LHSLLTAFNEGVHHKRQRQIVKPVFSVSQLKELMPVFYDVAEKVQKTRFISDHSFLIKCKLADVLSAETQTKQEIDMLEWMCRVALECVGRTILGYSFDPLDSPHNNPYTSAIKELM